VYVTIGITNELQTIETNMLYDIFTGLILEMLSVVITLYEREICKWNDWRNM